MLNVPERRRAALGCVPCHRGNPSGPFLARSRSGGCLSLPAEPVGREQAAPNRQGVAAPEGLTLRHHRDLEGRERRPIVRWGLVGLLAALLGAGLLNAFGQTPALSTAAAGAAELELSAPRALRSGLYFQARFRIRAHEELDSATLVLDPDWLEGMTLNTLAPAPVGEASRDGAIALELGRVPAGAEHLLYL